MRIFSQYHHTDLSVPVPPPPSSHTAAFQVVECSQERRERTVRLYWRLIAPDQTNGPDFRFSVNDNWTTVNYYLNIEHVSFEEELFKLTTQNKVQFFLKITACPLSFVSCQVGDSEKSFKFFIPSEERRREIANVEKSLLIETGNSTVLAWSQERN